MIANILYLLIISSGSVFLAATREKQFEETIAFTQLSIILILFFFGMCGALYFGSVAIMVLAAALYLFSFWYVVKHRMWKKFAEKCFSTGTIIFLLAYAVLSFYNYGRRGCNWDELTHWMDIVKVMHVYDDFGTDPQYYSAFPSYPPGISLLQYFTQKINQLVCPEAEFLDWLLFQCIQTFMVSMFFPFMKDVSFRKPVRLLLMSAITFFSPLVYCYGMQYDNLQVDSLIGIMSGTGLAFICLEKKKDWLYHGHIWLLCAVVTLIKDVGVLLALFLCIAYSGDSLIRCRKNTPGSMGQPGLYRRDWKIFTPFLLTGGMKILWMLEVRSSAAEEILSETNGWTNSLHIFFESLDEILVFTYQYFKAMVERGFALSALGIEVSFLLMLGIYGIASYLIWRNTESGEKKTVALVCWLQVLQCIAFIIGMFFLYLYRFSPYEKESLASIERYLGIAYTASWVFILLIAQQVTQNAMEKAEIRQVELLLVVLLTIPATGLANTFYWDRQWVMDKRQKYDDLSHQIKEVCEEGSAVWILAQEDDGWAFQILRHSIRPHVVPEGCVTTLGNPSSDQVRYFEDLTVEQWQQRLIKDFDYVVINKLNDYFYENYAEAFEEPSSIAEQKIYRVDKITGMLSLCESQ